MSQHVSLSVTTREERGSAKNSRLRKEGKLPGVLYQPGGDSLAFTADEYEVRRLISRGGVRSAVIDLTIDSSAPRTVLFKQWDRDPVRDQITHLDLQEVDLTVEVEADVPVILIGSAVGIRDGGILDQTSLTVRVRALPDALPRSIEHDISEVELGGSVHVHELVVPAGVTIVTDPEGGIASIMATRASLSDGTAEGGDAEGEGGAPAAADAPAGDSGDGEE
jgi:large subunit ribosomal protein L25